MFGFLLTAVSSGCTDEGDPDEKQVEESMAAVEMYEDVGLAIQDGYFNTMHFVSSPDGGMGVHFLNPSIVEVDHLRPNVLMYDVEDDGTYTLLGAEWFVSADAVSEAPSLFGQVFEGPMEGHEEGQPEHYELHAWFFTENPDGMFAEFNPDVQAPSWWADAELALGAAAGLMTPEDAANAGYIDTMECVEEPDAGGGMGVHFVNPEIMTLDPAQPQILLFADLGSGMQLAGLEWAVPSEGLTEPPEMFGRPFDGPMPGHEPGQPEHYDLHAWLVAPNPSGMFGAFNPILSCD